MTIVATTTSFAPSAVIMKRIRALPPRALAKYRKLDRAERLRKSRADARWEQIRNLQEKKHEAQRALALLQRHDDAGKLTERAVHFDPNTGEAVVHIQRDSRLIAEEEELIREIDTDIRALQAEEAADPRGITGTDVKNWIGSRPSGERYRDREVAVKPRKNETIAAALARITETVIDFRQQDKVASRAWLTNEEALTRAIADIDAMARKGAPNFTPVFLMQSNVADQRSQGHIKWPEMYLPNREWTDRGVAFTAWLFRDQLVERAKREIAALARPETALSAAERKLRRAEIAATILDLEYEYEALFEMAEKAKMPDIARLPGMSMLAILGIEVVP